MNKVSIYHLEIDRDKCVGCGKCQNICKMEVNPVDKPASAECIRCGECVHACPDNALYLGFKLQGRKTPEIQIQKAQVQKAAHAKEKGRV